MRKMTKREMLNEISSKLNWKESQIANRERNPYKVIESAYRFYQKTNKTIKDQAFVMNAIGIW